MIYANINKDTELKRKVETVLTFAVNEDKSIKSISEENDVCRVSEVNVSS